MKSSRLCVLIAAWIATAAAAENPFGSMMKDGGKDALDALLDDPSAAAKSDLALIRVSHLMELEEWPGVRPVAVKDQDKKTNYAWSAVAEPGYDSLKSFCSRARHTVTPVSGAPLRSTVTPPEAGSYRVWLCYVAVPGKAYPLKLTLGTNTVVFNETALSGTESGLEQEQARPICFETEHERIAPPSKPTFLWECRDVELAAAPLAVTLEASPGAVRVDALFLTRSRDFRPSKTSDREANTLGRTCLRFRVVGGPATGLYQFSDKLMYHWRHFLFGVENPLWYSHLEREIEGVTVYGDDRGKPVPAGTWSRWREAGGALLSAGTYVTGTINCPDAKNVGMIEAQIAWYPHEAAVVKTIQVPVAAGAPGGTYLVPVYLPSVPLPKGWGMRSADWLARFRPAVEVDREHLSLVEQLGLPDGPLPYKVMLTSGGSNPDPASAEATAAMLRKLGLSHANLPKAALAKVGMRQEFFTHHNDLMYAAKTHCPCDPLLGRKFAAYFRGVADNAVRAGWRVEDVTLAKFGDEIGSIRTPDHVNRCSDCRAHFHDYLASRWGGPEFFGETNWDCVDQMPVRGGDGLYERRLFYASSRFRADFTADFYRTATEQITNSLPRCRTYCNFSPHPVIMGGSMNDSEWFNLTRRGGTTLAWGEDWASQFSWGFWMGRQIVSYYAAWVECAARGTGHGGGFYAVGGGAHQQLSCIAHGLDTVVLYNYGPEYAGTEIGNCWSESDRAGYADIASGLHALGAADTIIAEGRRELPAVGLFYNRDYEIWSPETSRLMQTDRVGLFVALEHAGLPVAIVLDEDLAAKEQPYKAIYLNGFNLSAEALNSLSNYVAAGGVVVASAGVGTRDRFNGPRPDGVFGIRATVVGLTEGGSSPNDVGDHKPLGTVTLDVAGGGKLVWPVIGVKAKLEPQEGVEVETLGRFEDGSPAVVRRRLGKGSVTVYGVSPGILYRARAPRDAAGVEYNAYKPEDAAFIAAPAREAAGRREHCFSLPLVETRRFDHAEGTAITLNNFYFQPMTHGELEVHWPANRPLTEVRAALGGTLKWTRDGDWVRMPVALTGAVEVVVLR